MQVSVSTVYTKERLLRFSNYLAVSKKFIWLFMGICTSLILSFVAFLAVVDAISFTIAMCTFAIIALDVLYIFMSFVYPKLTVNKAKNLGARIDYTFTEEGIHIKAYGSLFTEESTLKYSYLSKIGYKAGDIYLFFNPTHAFVVDISGLSLEDISIIRSFISRSLPENKIKW